ncbi:MAG: ATP-binding protein, partial [Bifidobacteriaceae bacterium]|nr:ATP-binding protein [Bifidobacteriaceae bacterium]
ATPLALVLTELITNAVEHGYGDGRNGIITISAGRSNSNLNVVVEDDGMGVSLSKDDDMPKSSGSGLGTQIIKTFVTNDFGGDVSWSPLIDGGTRVAINLKLRAVE